MALYLFAVGRILLYFKLIFITLNGSELSPNGLVVHKGVRVLYRVFKIGLVNIFL